MKLTNHYFEALSKKDIPGLLNKSFSIKTAYFLARIFDKIETEAKPYFDQKQKLIKKYASLDDQGNVISNGNGIKFDNPVKFNEEFAELLNIEINFEWKKVVIDFDKENVSLKIDEMMILIPFIQEVQNG
jgi:hypothetical protein